MNTTWIIEWMQTTTDTASPPKCVITAGWRCNGTDGTFSGTVYGTCSFAAPGDPFTVYDDLTEDQVLSWCWGSGVPKEATEEAIAKQIENQKNPPVIQPPLPWLTS